MLHFLHRCRRNFTLVCGTTALIAAQACHAPQEESNLSAVPAPEYAIYLGAGVETLESSRPKGLALDHDSKYVIRFPGMSRQSSNFEIVENHEQLKELYRRTISNTTQASFYGVDVEASVSSFAEQTSNFESSNISLAIIVVYLRDKVILDSARFSDSASDLIEAGQMDRFRERFGNAFVREVDLGGYLLIQYNVSTQSLTTQDISRLKAALSIKYAQLVQNTTSVQIDHETERLLSSVSRTGRVISSARSLNSSNLIDTAEKYQETVREFASYFDRSDVEWTSLIRRIATYDQVYDSRFAGVDFPKIEAPVPPPPEPREIEHYWTPHVSEEQGEAFPAVCTNGLALGFHCRGRFCDDIALLCQKPYQASRSLWTDYFSEERNNFRICPDGYFVSGIRCRGRYCDDISLQCSQVPNLELKRNTCHWSQSFSEEHGGLMSNPKSYYVAGMECRGRYCDNKRAWLCQADYKH